MLGNQFGVSQPQQVGARGTAISNSRDPAEAPACFSYTLNFVATPISLIDLSIPEQQGAMTGIQTLYIDNSLNDKAVVITMQGTNQRLPIGSGQAGYFPLLGGTPTKITLDGTGSTTGTAVFVGFMNVPMPAASWYAYDTHTHGP